MNDNNRGGPPSTGQKPGGAKPDGANRRGGPGGDNRGQGPRGGGGRAEGRSGGPRKGGRPGAAPAKPVRIETYESLTEVTRGPDFKIAKRVIAEKGTHRPVKIEYRLTREGMKQPQYFARLGEAQAASTAPLPEPEPEIIEVTADAAPDSDAPPGETEDLASDPAQDTAPSPAEHHEPAA